MADLRRLALTAPHARSRERFLALHDIAQGTYPSGGHRLAFADLAGDLSGVCTSAVKIGVGCLDGDHHRG